MKSNRSYPVWIIVALLVILLAGCYMGSYYALLDEIHGTEEQFSLDPVYSSRIRRIPSYGKRLSYEETIFLPAHWLDCQIRPDFWRWYAKGEPGAP